ncbi:MAG: BrnT family toxin [Candidatus Riflebacteria bacterium]|nr:BrnT family toxin [Candidatus Riflebacteria bacterium]
MGKLLNVYDLIRNSLGFEWNEGNEIKNWSSHHVSQIECEAVFLNDPIIKFEREHSQIERRFMAMGKTDQERYLFVSFTVRKKMIRIISTRAMTKGEFKEYENYEEKNS